MRAKIMTASGTLLMGIAMLFLAIKSDPTASADTMALDPLAVTRFKIVLGIGVILVIISFILFAIAALSVDKKTT